MISNSRLNDKVDSNESIGSQPVVAVTVVKVVGEGEAEECVAAKALRQGQPSSYMI